MRLAGVRLRESISSCRTYVGVCRARTTAVSRCSIYRRRRVKNLRRCEYSARAHGSRIFPLPRHAGQDLRRTFGDQHPVCLASCGKEHNPGKRRRRRKGKPCSFAICERASPRAFDNRLVIEENCYWRSCATSLSLHSTREFAP